MPAGIDIRSGGSPTLVGAATVGSPTVKPGAQGQVIPFRRATLERGDRAQVDTQALTANVQPLERPLPPWGYAYQARLRFSAVHPSNNSANVAYNEDAPWNACASLVLRDVDAPILDYSPVSSGWNAYQIAKYGGWMPFDDAASLDTNVYSLTTGTGASGGDFTFHVRAPLALNRRTLLGLSGNQDRAQTLNLRGDLAASATIYSTAPTAAPNVTITRHYDSYTVPPPVNDQQLPNQQVPPFFGVIPMVNVSVSPSAPSGGQQTTHQLQRINTTFRLLLCVLRSNGSRSTAESNLPTLLQFQLGNQPLYTEDVQNRRLLMHERFGMDAPSGVIAYDFLHDFQSWSGAELGHDWLWTQQLNAGYLYFTYPAGFGSTNNSLTVITSDMSVPQGMDLYAP